MKLPKGFLASGIHCGINKGDKEDLGVIYSQVPAIASGVFTKNKVKAASILVCLKNLKNSKARAIIVNSGCANACTGKKGIKDALSMAELVAKFLKVSKEDVIVASTGLIGEFLPMNRIKKGMKRLCKDIVLYSPEDFNSFAKAIMTTDTFSKVLSRQFFIGKNKVTIVGIAKGAGMIYPNMGTMLCFLITDLKITPPLLHRALKDSINSSFNMITVDGDTSTNDMVVILANGLADNELIKTPNREFYTFSEYLKEITLKLARMIASDGEGATKFLEITVKGTKNFSDAKKIAFNVANSNLVKTAMFGEDPNWGRIMAAIGKTDARINPQKIDIYITISDIRNRHGMKIKLVNNGCAAKFNEEKVKNILCNNKIGIVIDLKNGKQTATVFSCDLSPDYVKINANYTS